MIEWLLIRLLKTLQLLQMKKQGPTRRGQHPKCHGCVIGEFSVADDIPGHLRVGIFAQPHSFPAIIRFSNGAKTDDRENDVHGMAIKLLEVPGRKILEGEEGEATQDFILADSPVFFARDVWHLIQFALSKSKPEKVRRTHPAFEGFIKPAASSPLTTSYWSQTPYRLGTSVVRYEVRPAQNNGEGGTDRTSPDFLRLALADFLSERAAHFDFMVQPAPDESVRWSEDPTLSWDTDAVRVATLTIPPQQFDTPTRDQLGENLTYTPWHSLPEHAPLSQINRARKIVYRASSERRHQVTGSEMREPTSKDL